jgi:hypothetical protein
MLTMTNQDFCYWLQGYFEITITPAINKNKILIIRDSLNRINQPLGEFTQWLSDVISFFEEQHYRKELLDYFLPEIIDRLHAVFYHVIDNSYDTPLSAEEAKRIHDGVNHD